MTIEELTQIILEQAREKKFGTSPEEINVAEKMALIHSEVSEAYEAYRHKNMDGRDGFKEELGDVLQRLLHLAGVFKIDLTAEVLKKVEINKSRNWDFENMNEQGGF